MRLLVDTQAFLFYSRGDPRLSRAAWSHIDDAGNDPLLSIGSAWEMAIKSAIGKLTLSEPVPVVVERMLFQYRFQLLPISLAHLAVVESLPLHHRDPFDRILAAQALLEGLTLVSADPAFDAYGVPRLW